MGRWWVRPGPRRPLLTRLLKEDHFTPGCWKGPRAPATQPSPWSLPFSVGFGPPHPHLLMRKQGPDSPGRVVPAHTSPRCRFQGPVVSGAQQDFPEMAAGDQHWEFRQCRGPRDSASACMPPFPSRCLRPLTTLALSPTPLLGRKYS